MYVHNSFPRTSCLSTRKVSLNIPHRGCVHPSRPFQVIVVEDVVREIQYERDVDHRIRPVRYGRDRDDDVAHRPWRLDRGRVHARVDADIGQDGDGKRAQQHGLFPAVRDGRGAVAAQGRVVLPHLAAGAERHGLDGEAGEKLA